MTDQQNLPVYTQDRDDFKKMAADLQMSMKDLFHKWMERARKRMAKK